MRSLLMIRLQLLRNFVASHPNVLSYENLNVAKSRNAFTCNVRHCSQLTSLTDDVNIDENGNMKTKRRIAAVPKTNDEYILMKKRSVVSPVNSKVLTVALLGLPNSGKSTLTNMLMQWRVCSVSKKVHTTRKNTKAVYVDGKTQIIFIDTPGLISYAEKKKHQLTDTMLNDPKTSIMKADVVAILIDASNRWTRYDIDPKIMELLKKHPKMKTILILNKVDLIKTKRILLEIVDSLTDGIVGNQKSVVVKETKNDKTADSLFKSTKIRLQKKDEPKSQESPEKDKRTWPLFQEVFFVSALKNDGIEDLRAYLLKNAKSGPWHHPSSFVTDQDPKDIVIEAVREKLMDNLPKEIPYELKLEIEQWEVNDVLIQIIMNVNCQRQNIQKLVIGPRGETIARIADHAQQDLMNTFRSDVILKLIVQHKQATNVK